MYTTFTILGHSFSSYWTVFSIGLLVMVIINLIRRKKMQVSFPGAVAYTLLICFFSLVGAKLLYAAENWDTFLANGITLDGVSFFGSVFFLPAAMYVICRCRKISYGAFMDYCAPSLITMLAIIRIGCFLNGCCGGVTYQTGTYTTAVVPTQLIECIGDFMILGVLFLVEWHESGKGLLYPYIMIFYGCLRFILEFLRDTPKDWLYLSHGQWFAMASVLFGAIVLQKTMKKIVPQNKRKKRK